MKHILLTLLILLISTVSYAKTTTISVTKDAYLESRDATWSGARDASESDLVTGITVDAIIKATYDSQPSPADLFNCYRIIMSFDTSSLPDDVIIQSAKIRLRPTSVNINHDGPDYVTIVSASPASSTSFVVADFDDVGSTKFITDVDSSSLVEDEYNDFPLNDSGINYINKEGYTIFAVRIGNDYDNVTPTEGVNNITFYSGNGAFSSRYPLLEITYRTPREVGSGSIGNGSFN